MFPENFLQPAANFPGSKKPSCTLAMTFPVTGKGCYTLVTNFPGSGKPCCTLATNIPGKNLSKEKTTEKLRWHFIEN
ncbi:hypothetical protein [Chryseobacterium taichungense]|uniref:hypothetical protein n=1 Tax=Chryseobacterium taichungense TaxID=295069 RepID=UPI0028B215C4|nr:hypothetical protein [Chryseobacterium taichungense]